MKHIFSFELQAPVGVDCIVTPFTKWEKVEECLGDSYKKPVSKY